MSDIEKVMVDLTALKEEFGVEFQLADPGAPVTVEQRTINNLFCALLEARAALGDAKPRPGTDSPVPRTYWFKEPDDDTEAALGDVEPEPLEDVRREFRRIDQKQGRAKAAYFAYGAAKALNTTVYDILRLSFDEAITAALREEELEPLEDLLDGFVVGWLGWLSGEDGSGAWHTEVAKRIDHDLEEAAEGSGPTPEAALRAAVANAKGEGDG